MTKYGCPIEDIAPDRQAQAFIDAFVRYYTAESEAAKGAIASAYGLLDDIDLYMLLEAEVKAHKVREQSKTKGAPKRGRRR